MTTQTLYSGFPAALARGGTFDLGDPVSQWWLSTLPVNPYSVIAAFRLIANVSSNAIDITTITRDTSGYAVVWQHRVEGTFKIDANNAMASGTPAVTYQAYTSWNSDGSQGAAKYQSTIHANGPPVNGIDPSIWSKYFEQNSRYQSTQFASAPDTPTTSSSTNSLSGKEGDDTILGTTLNDTIDGKGGDDKIVAGVGDDTVMGGSGSDTLLGGFGNDVLNGGAEPIADFLYGEEDNDYLAGGGGPDQLYGGIGNDEIRAGHGKDTISGGNGADILYGGGGTNTFLSEADGSIDQLYVMSDFRGHAFDWGRNHGGINADIITEIDANDRITILGTSDSALTFRAVAAGTYNQTLSGIGIFDGDSLEALYIGSNLNASQLDSMTTGDPTRFS